MDFGRELFKLAPDGVTPLLVADVMPGDTSSNPSPLAAFNGNLYFVADTPGTSRELYHYDPGTGTLDVTDLNPSSGGSDAGGFTEFAGALYFTASSDADGRELYRSQAGGDTPDLIDLTLGPDSTNPGNFAIFSGNLVFTAGGEFYSLTLGSLTPVGMPFAGISGLGNLIVI